MKPMTYDELEGLRAELNALNEDLHSRNLELERLLQEALRLINKVPNTRFPGNSYSKSYDLATAIEHALKATGGGA